MSDQLANGHDDAPDHRALRASEERLRLLVQNAADVIAVVDSDAIVTYVSPSVSRLFGHDPAAVMGRSAFDLIDPSDRPRVLAAFEEALTSGGSLPPVEFRARHGDGLYHDVEAVLTNLLDEPTINGVVVNVRDITDRKQAEAALRASNERFRLLVEGSRDILSYRYRFQPEPACEYMSPGAQSVLGIPPEAFYA